MRSGVALLSGGLDSGVAAACFHREPGQRLAAALFCDYGQRAARREAEAAARLAQRLDVPLHRAALPWLGDCARRAGSRLAPDTGALPTSTVAHPGDAASAAAVWVPARNCVLVSMAAALAESLGAACVVAGFNREEAATFPDNSPAFLTAATAMLALGTRNAVRVESPTLAWDKPRIVEEALRQGFGAGDFWSCYEGGEQPCGTCESCVRSRFGR
ncbi:MAG: 7-cyano-7-deazaguanine synthase [Planctomycetes bacterium]|nr:7-cyano-7-deazaguanine synthase [Planctomycetota bacterium]